ncbi:MAG TPA: MFS transporter, partial [Hyphomicrobiales bacterium]|nr:MFS transporter [Hyphomicrobiales bacterium]
MIVRILAILSVAFVLSQFYRSVMAVIAPEIGREVRLNSGQLGVLSAAFFVAFGLMQIPVGVLLDRFGQRRTIAITLLVTTGGTLWFALGQDFVGLTAARALMGVGCAAVFMGVLVTCSRWLPPARFGSASSVSIGIGGLGVLLATTPFVALQTLVGWRGAFLIIAVVTGATALATWLGVRDAPPGHPSHDRPSESLRDVLRGVRQVLGNRQLPYVLAVAFTGYSSVMAVVGMWGGPYLDAVFGLTGVARGNVLFAIAAAVVSGSFLFGFLDQVVRTRTRLMLASGSIVAAVFVTLAAVPGLSAWQVTGLLMLLALANGYVVLNYAQARLL